MTLASIEKLITKDDKGEKSKLEDLIVLIYGDKKVGKSTFAAQFPKPLFLDFESGLRTVHGPDGTRPDHIQVTSWQQVLDITKHLEEGVDYKTIVIDGLNEAWNLLVKYTLETYGVTDENEGALAYGKGGRYMRRQMRWWFAQLRKLPYGIVLTAHDTILPFEHNNVTYDKRVPLIDEGKKAEAWTAMKPSINMILYAHKLEGKDGVKHVMRTKGTQLIEAADPYGHLPELMHFDYAQLEKAVNNTGKEKK